MKEISAPSIIALKDALKHIYWRKRPLRDFLYHTLQNNMIVSTLDFNSETKGETVSKLIDRMLARKDLYGEDILKLFDAVAHFEDFSHLEREEDAESKIKAAKASVEALKKHTTGHFEIKEESRLAEERKNVQQKLQAERAATTERIVALKRDFEQLVPLAPQSRGFAFEKYLNDVFDFFDLDPRRSFKLTGEQIDGAFTFEHLDYLVEAKWQNDPVNASMLHSFAGKVSEKFKATVGLYISFNGFSADALAAGGSNVKSMILMDGMDISYVMESRIDLPELLYRKRRHAAETGNIYLKASDLVLGT